MKKKLLILVLIAAVAALFYALDFQSFFTLDYIKASQTRFQAYYDDHPVLVVALYMGAYVIVTAFSLPGAAIMTLAGGALLGFWVGLAATSFASSIGATLACFFARYILRDWVQTRFAGRLETVNKHLEKEGAFYLFTLRLVPLFPFFVINLVMGLTRMKLSTFYWVSQAGMLAGTAVYVNAGKELGQIQSLPEILSPGVVVSFAILGIFPIVTRKLLAVYRDRKRTA